MSQLINNCPVCNGSKHTRSYVIRGHAYYKCNDCGTLYLGAEEKISKSVDKQYDDKYFKETLKENLTGYMDYAGQSLPLRKNFRIMLSRIKHHLIFDRHLSLLDVGCAYGFFLDEARKMGMSVHGLDLSESAIKWMEKNLGIKGTIGISSDAPEGPFDIITAIEVIEHVMDPHPFMKDLHKRIKDGGLLVIHTGAIDSLTARLLGRFWWYLNPPDHCTIYSRQSLRRLIADNGFDLLEHRLRYVEWGGLNNILLKLARIFGSKRLGRLASKLPALALPVFHNCAQLLIARKR